ncbi:MAG: 5'-methylthioadenosine/S-adenosylhomocysteine nucleosidase [Bdellovibrionales bacterium]|nr:5'-methylthioadenosine/S-adenosylhomocysteine nucleosidase [Bdellovibrionales bacterium]
MRLILCPLQIELDWVRSIFQERGFSLIEKSLAAKLSYWQSSEGWLLASGGHGKINYALRASRILTSLPAIESVICLGAAGGLGPQVSPLDVVVGTESIEHDFKPASPKVPRPIVKADGELLAQAREYRPMDFQVHFGPIASGDEDIQSSERVEALLEQTAALAVAWEGMAAAKACRHFGKKFLEIRGVTDLCSSHLLSEFGKNLERAIKNATEVALSSHSHDL